MIEELNMSAKKAIALCLLIVTCAFSISATKDKKSAKAVERIMKNMKTPAKELKKLERAKLYTKSSFASYVATLTRESKNMLRIKHPDKDFNDISKDLFKEMTILQKAVKKKDFNAIKKSWNEAKQLCAECHDIYQDL